MKTDYSDRDILKMAVGLMPKDKNADLDQDNEITVADARLANRLASGLTQDGSETKVDNKDLRSVLSQTLLSQLMSEGQSEGNVNAEALYQQYKNGYQKDAALAAENAYGLASTKNGGYGSSYASISAQNAYSQVMDDYYKQLPQLRESVLKERSSQQDAILQALDYLAQEENREQTYRTQAQENKRKQAQSELDFAETAAKYGDTAYLTALGIDTDGYLSESALKNAETAAKYGDYSALQKLGINTDTASYSELLRLALSLAEYGDYSALERLGVDTTQLKRQTMLTDALNAASKAKDYSLYYAYLNRY